MSEKRTGAIILAAGKSEELEGLKPLRKMGQTTMIQKGIDTLRQAGITPIVVVTGYQAEELERHIAHRGAVCVRNKKYENSQMFDSVCLGLKKIGKKTDQVLLCPVDIPLISPDTLIRIKETNAGIVIPVYQGKTGHPVLLGKEIFPAIMNYEGDRGLRGAIEACGEEIVHLELEDPCILMNTNTEADYADLLQYEEDSRKRIPLTFSIQAKLCRPAECFDECTASFLTAVEEQGSMFSACQSEGISYSKAWKMVKQAEEQLGIVFLERQTGGSKGGSSTLTEEGRRFIERYRLWMEKVQEAAGLLFEEVFEG